MASKARVVAAVLVGAVALTGIMATAAFVAFPSVGLNLARSYERGRAGLTQNVVQLEGDEHRVVYLRGGQGPTVLLLHGFSADKDNWTRLAPHLEGLDLVIPDLPGHGETTRSESASYDIRAQVAWVKTLHDQLGLGPVHLVGNSMGGHISAAYAVAYPEDVASLALVNPGGITSPVESELTQALKKGWNPLLVEDVADYDRLIDFIFVTPPYIPGPVKAFFAEQAVMHRDFNNEIFVDLGRKPYPLEPVLERIGAPTLIVWGDSDRVLHPSGAAVFDGGIPNSRVAMLEDVGHAPMIEQPEETAAILLDFWGSAPVSR